MKKRMVSICLAMVLICLMIAPAGAASGAPQITLQPQNPNYPEDSVASYQVKATGSNLQATWYLEFEGKTYNISDTSGSRQPWEDYAGETYGATNEGSGTFTYVFGGIGFQLNGSSIWCVISDGKNKVTSQKATISLGNPENPPQIESFPAQLTVEKGKTAKLKCEALAPGDSVLSYAWYETRTGRLENIQAIEEETGIGQVYTCDTSQVGTRYYVCMVRTNQGGIAYSSVAPVTVTEPAISMVEVQIKTKELPQAQEGQSYSTTIQCSDPDAEFGVYYNPGKANDFEKTGLSLSKTGTISGTPKAAGTYTFTFYASGAAGEDYMEYTLKVSEAPVETTAPVEQTTAPVEQTTAEAVPTEPTELDVDSDGNSDLSTTVLWILLALLVVLLATVAGIGVAILLTMIVGKKKK